MHKLPKSKKIKRSMFKTDMDYFRACYNAGKEMQGIKYLSRKEYKREQWENHRDAILSVADQLLEQRATPLSASKALCPIVIPVSITPG